MNALTLSRPLHRLPLSTLGLLLLGASCSLACSDSDDLQEEAQEVQPFTSVIVSDGFQASITNGSEYKALLVADPDVIDDIVFTQSGETIEVSCSSCNASDAPYDVQFTMPVVTAVTLTGASQLTASNVPFDENVTVKVSDSSEVSLLSENTNYEDNEPTTIDSLELTCENSSSCTLTVFTNELTIAASDSSSVTLNGEGLDLDLTLSDSSDISAEGLDSQDVTVDFSNASSGSINASGTVTGDLNNASSIDVSGGAEVTVETDDDSSITEN